MPGDLIPDDLIPGDHGTQTPRYLALRFSSIRIQTLRPIEIEFPQ